MANTATISDFPEVLVALLSDLVPVVQSDVTSHETWQQVLDLFNTQIFSVTNSITAFAGGGQTGGTVISSASNRVSTVASSGDSIKMTSSPVLGKQYFIRNDGANACNLYPPVNGQINSLGLNLPLSIPAASQIIIIAFSSTQFYTIS
jgi:hypothetical protein